MRVGSVAQNMAAPAAVFDNLESQQANSSEILLAVQYYNYQQYKANAYTNGDVTIINDRIYDVAGKNPYETKTLFAIIPLKKELRGRTFSFKLPSTLIYTNTGLTLNQVQVDFGNGQGYQTISFNIAKNVTYSSGGEKEIKVKFVYNGGSTLYSHSKIWVDYVAPSVKQVRFNGTGIDTHVIVGDAWQGSSATGYATVELAPGHAQLTKPLIVVEGFDPDNSFDYFDFINTDKSGGIYVDIDPTGTILTLNQAIEDEGYDLVFVNFANGTDYIQRNAYMVEKVIDWVNVQKTEAGSSEKNVVLGMSMGGLVARYALRHMEIDGDPNTNHDTKLYISHDAPHQGANVPLAFQAMVRHLVGEEISLPVFLSLIDVNIVDFTDISPDLEDGLALLQTPAAQQMLIYQLQGVGDNISVDISTLHGSFATEYKNMGYPQQGGIRNIAIANGSECGASLGFDPYDTIVHVNEKIDLPHFLTNIALAIVNGLSLNPLRFVTSILSTDTDVKVQFTAKALPNQQSKQIYKGKIFIEKTILFVIDVEEPLIDQETLNSSSSMLPLDNAGGGIYNLELFVELPSGMDSYVLEKQFDFIPTYSSLDIGGGNQVMNYVDLTKSYSPLSPPETPKNTPFDNFYTNPTTSQNHIQFTLNNGNWLMDELRGDEAFYSCASSCDQLELFITGSDNLCATNTYNINNLTSAPEIEVEWSVIPTTATTMTTVNNSATLTYNNPFWGGLVTLTASINTKCDDIIIEKKIWVGGPSVIAKLNDGKYISHIAPNSVCKYQQIKTNMIINGETNVIWTLLNSSQITLWHQVDNNLSFYLWEDNQTATFRLTTTNNCGTTTRDYTFVAEDCSGGGNDPCDQSFFVSPNPANTIIEITSNIPAPCPPVLGRTAQPSTAVLYDFTGNSVRSKTPAEGKMSVEKLKSGHYILVISNNGEKKSHRIIIN